MLSSLPKFFSKENDKLVSFLNFLKEKAPFLFNLKVEAKTDLVGLDFAYNSLKVLKIDQSTTPYRIEHFAVNPFSYENFLKDEANNFLVTGEEIKSLFKKAGIKSKNIALAVPRSIALIKTITIDSRLTPNEIESRAWIEANRHFPDLINEIYLDFVVLEPAVNNAPQLELLLVACRKAQIKPYLESIKQAGLTASVVDVNCYALERALPLLIAPPPVATQALLNLNINFSSLIVVDNDKLIYANDQNYDGQRLISQVTQFINNKELDKSKLDENALLAEESYLEVLRENLIAHFHHTMHFFSASRPNITIQKLVISGDCATLPGLAAFLQKESGLLTVLANPLANLTYDENTLGSEIKEYAPTLALCCGLALSKKSG